ncbi:MAG: hypothetical protein M1821_001803 [Bathelium mastoideum]|nr:MAG: hypothetical protein M1821_001803 [Bathelium mastoideum]
MSLPSILLVPGAWHCKEHYEPLVELLQKDYGFRCFAIDLPSVEQSDIVSSIDVDTETIRFAALHILDGQDGRPNAPPNDLIVVMHSYGGVPGSNALQGLNKSERAKQGKHNGIIGVAYIASFLPDEGRSVATTVTGDVQDWMNNISWKAIGEQHTWPKNPTDTFYHDLSDQEARHWASKLKRQSLGTNLTPIKYAAWKHYPTAYLLTEHDKALPIFVQQMLLDKALAAGTVALEERIQTGHSPFLKDPKATADFLARFTQRL